MTKFTSLSVIFILFFFSCKKPNNGLLVGKEKNTKFERKNTMNRGCFTERYLDDSVLVASPYELAKTIAVTDTFYSNFMNTVSLNTYFTNEKLGTPNCNDIWKVNLRDQNEISFLLFTTNKAIRDSSEYKIRTFVYALYNNFTRQYFAQRVEKFFVSINNRDHLIKEKFFNLDDLLIEEIDYSLYSISNQTFHNRDERPICFNSYKTCMRWFASAQEDDWLCDWLPCTTMNTLACKGAVYYGWVGTSSNFVGANSCKCGTIISSATQQPCD